MGDELQRVCDVAFQNHSVFHSVLQRLAQSGTLGEFAPAENFLLDERVSDHRG